MRVTHLLLVVVAVVTLGRMVEGGRGKGKIRAGDEEHHRVRKQLDKKAKSDSSHNPAPVLPLEDAEYWRQDGQAELVQQLTVAPQVAQAKNIIFVLGDGMSFSTVTAARIMKGQQTSQWERESLSWETFPYSAIIKTYTTDSQVADSSSSATAYLCGVKANRGTAGVDVNVDRGNCTAQVNPAFHTLSIAKWFQDAGKSTGFVTNTRVTHATPSALYSHICERTWENDKEVVADGEDPLVCNDIAEQLVLQEPGNKLKVIMGGGRRNLLPDTVMDVEYNSYGYRGDDRNLIQEWQDQKAALPAPADYVWNRDDLLAINTSSTQYLMGLFDFSHMDYLVERDNTMDPSLPEMTKVALEIIQQDNNGYFLLVEGGLIDLAHHGNRGQKAVTETVELSEVVELVLSMTDPTDTLIVVTADHAHTININGYPDRHTDILGLADVSDKDNLPYTTLLYGNGPGYQHQFNGLRPNITNDDLHDVDYRQAATVPESTAAHAGDDVGIWALGPQAHLFTGVHEQSYIAYALAYASCVGDGLTFCESK